MWPDLVILSEPDIDGDLGLFGAVKPLCIEDFATECSVEALVVSVLSRAAWIDLDRVDADLDKPLLQRSRDELRTIVGTDIVWPAPFQDQLIERLQHLIGTHL